MPIRYSAPLLALGLLIVMTIVTGWAMHSFAPTVLFLGTGLIIIAILSVRPPTLVSELVEAPLPAPAPNFSALLIAALSDPVLIVTHGRVTRANAPARAILGDHIINQDVRVALRNPGVTPLLLPRSQDGIVEVSGISGRDQHWEIRVSTISPGTRVIQMVDRTARYAAERARTDFVANASHELRTPLAAVLGFIETLADETAGGDPKTRARFLKVMESEAQRMQRLIDDLISLSRIEAERHHAPQTAIDLTQLIAQAARELKSAQGDPANVILDFAEDIPTVTGDRMQLQQLIHNLLSNAFKYGRPNTPVRVMLERESTKMLKLSVIDQGDGISPEHIPRLTERFYRVDSARSRAGGGTGLGLAIVKHIVERHRGKLDISSVMGVGTTVSVTFPI